eukprot:CAMPEP_0170608752 /NCGR_PEP_ID=MMETSP0224-20130122/21753_1 /TAXON_ID=285029 /ORGANISM="Togula jolla, Strain CCCM 725" /LENGTH=236 /DNA_ID=CAMNT_0010934001 /DNA_START=80 /DNA_END=790 /DNA_ORIENTATION=-
MGQSSSSMFRRLRGHTEMKVLMVGLDAAGKTTVLYQLKLGEVTTQIPTIGFNVECVQARGRSLVSFTAWDIGGRDKIRPLWRHYYQGINALIFVVDSNDRDRLEDASDQLEKMLEEDELQEAPLLVMANKQDLPNAMKVPAIVEALGLNRLRGRQWYIQPTVAMTGSGLWEGLDWLMEAFKNKSKTNGSSKIPFEESVAPSIEVQAGRIKVGPASEADTASTADTELAAIEEVTAM